MSEQKRHSRMSLTLALGVGLALGVLGTWSHGAAREAAAAGLQQGEAAALPQGAPANAATMPKQQIRAVLARRFMPVTDDAWSRQTIT